MVIQQDPKLQVAQYVVDGMPGMYKAAAEIAKDPDIKQYLHLASETFETIVRNPDTREVMVTSLVHSPLIETVMMEKDRLKQDPDATPQLKDQLLSKLSTLSLKKPE